MRGIFLLGCSFVALGTGIACASSEDDSQPIQDDESNPDVAVVAVDASTEDVGVVEPPPPPETCTSAGWCLTELPDVDLTLIDIWPLRGRAFAAAVSASLGTKIMEWVDADQQWTYIDDETQNENGFGRYVGRIWAPNENEVYYTVEPGYVYHGTRGGAAWSWERELLVPTLIATLGQDLSAPAVGKPETASLGVRGTSSGDVYAWRANTIYRRMSVDGGASQWVEEYSDGTSSQRSQIYSAAASEGGDIWFGGAHSGFGCPLLLRKGPDGYQTVFRSVFTVVPRLMCGPIPEASSLERPNEPSTGIAHSGALTDLHVGADGEVTALWHESTLTRFIPRDGGYDYVPEVVVEKKSGAGANFSASSLWVQGDEAWLTASGPNTASGWVFRGPLTGDANAFGLSSVALNGLPHVKPLYRIRGTDASNLWAVGARYAFHKTAP